MRLTDEHSPLKQFMHRFDAVIAAAIIAAAVWFAWSRYKVFKHHR